MLSVEPSHRRVFENVEVFFAFNSPELWVIDLSIQVSCTSTWSAAKVGSVISLTGFAIVRLGDTGMRKWFMALILLLIFLPLSFTAFGQEDLWKKLNWEMAELFQRGKYEAATKVARQALEIAEKTFGENHLNVSISLNNLATLHRASGNYRDAESCYKRSLSIKEKVLGPVDPKVATTLNNLAGLYRAQHKYAEAEALYERALAIREKNLKPDDPDLGQSLNNLALLYKNQGRYAEALALYKKALGIWEESLGPHDPDVATVLENMAQLYTELGEKEEAIRLDERARVIRAQH